MAPDANSEINGKFESSELKINTGFYEVALPLIEDLCLNNNGTIEDAKDLFQDGLLVVLKKLKNEKFILDCKLTTYLYRICKNIWYNELKNKEKLEKLLRNYY